MNPLTCVIVEDNQIDSDYLVSIVSQYTSLSLKEVFSNAIESAEYIASFQPDIVFMDIDMPGINGMQYFRQQSSGSIFVFVTAHSEFALEGFESRAFDFILKPVRLKRFIQVVDRINEYLQLLKRADLYDSQILASNITIKEGLEKYVVPLSDLLYIEALKDYSKIVTSSRKFMTLSKLKHFVERLPSDQFVRIHRSYAVAISKIKSFTNAEVMIEDITIPIGKTYRNNLKKMI